jgi:hypothetical protein
MMSKTYELWDAASQNLVGAYDSEAEALTYVRAYVNERGTEYASSWVLLWDDDEADQAGQIDEGLALLSRAERARSTPDVPPPIPHRRIG